MKLYKSVENEVGWREPHRLTFCCRRNPRAVVFSRILCSVVVQWSNLLSSIQFLRRKLSKMSKLQFYSPLESSFWSPNSHPPHYSPQNNVVLHCMRANTTTFRIILRYGCHTFCIIILNYQCEWWNTFFHTFTIFCLSSFMFLVGTCFSLLFMASKICSIGIVSGQVMLMEWRRWRL